jgi:hypothetical protein
MSKNQATTGGNVNADTISFRIRQFKPKGQPSAVAYKIIEEKTPDAADKAIFNSEVLSPEQLIAGLVNRNAATVIDRNIVYAPTVDWYEKAKAKKQHIPAAVIANWMEEGGTLIWSRSKIFGRKPQMQTPDALNTKVATVNEELSADDLIF